MIDAGLQDELQAALPMLAQQARRNAERDGVKRAIEPWFATYPQPQRSDAEWAAFWQGYVLVCGPFAEQALHGAMKAWAKLPESEYLPKPGKLADLARQQPTAGLKLYQRARAIASEVDKRLGVLRISADHENRQTNSEEQTQLIHAMLGGFQRDNASVREHMRRTLQRGIRHSDKPGGSYRMAPGRTAPGSSLTPEMLRTLGRPVPAAQDARPANDEPSEMI